MQPTVDACWQALCHGSDRGSEMVVDGAWPGGRAVRHVAWSVAVALWVIAGACLAGPVHAQASDWQEVSLPPPMPVRTSLWRREWPTFSVWEGAATVAAGLGTGALALVKPPKEALWQGPILF